MNIILHIGSDKTGTTALQSTLDAHRGDLLEKGIIYPKFSIDCHHEHLAIEVKNHTKGETWEKLTQILDQKPNTLILSSEMFCTYSESDIERLLNWLPSNKITVLCYLRSADEYLESGLMQRLKSCSSNKEFTRLYKLATLIPAAVNPLVYQAALKSSFVTKWRSLLSQSDSLIIRPYKKSLWYQQDLISDFFHSLDLDAPLAGISIETPANNLTPSLAVSYANHYFMQSKRPWIKHAFNEVMTTTLGQIKTRPITTYSKRQWALILERILSQYIFNFENPALNNSKAEKGNETPSLNSIKTQGTQHLVDYINQLHVEKNRKN